MHRSLERSQNSTTSQYCLENTFILSQKERPAFTVSTDDFLVKTRRKVF
jgi:hypothetical protein